MSMAPLVSIVIVSFNTRDLLRECLRSLDERSAGIPKEVFVVDNDSRDASADMVAAEFPATRLIRSAVNLGFAGANNRAFPLAAGRYVVLLNSDAFLTGDALARAIRHMDREPRVGLGGAKLVGRDGSWQPSARLFPSLTNDFLSLSGLAARYPRSPFFGRADRTWADQDQPCDTDWVPGAFVIIRREALQEVGFFDERFFLYYEEVDLCKRFWQAGFSVRYWPDVVVIHMGGESSKTVGQLGFSQSGSQLTLWRVRSAFLYYRKHHGSRARLAKEMEQTWHRLRAGKNKTSAPEKARESAAVQQLLEQAWRETAGGRESPPQPWGTASLSYEISNVTSHV